MPYFVFLKKQQNLKLSSAANHRWRFKLNWKELKLDVTKIKMKYYMNWTCSECGFSGPYHRIDTESL